jgi:hypothetical protein
VSSTGSFVNNASPVSIYSFFWRGGTLTIQEELGNNGIGRGVDVTLDPLGSPVSTAPGAALASILIPFQSGPTSLFTLIDHLSLAQGYYAIENAIDPTLPDPTFQIDFSFGAAVSVVPEPDTLLLLAAPFSLLVLSRRKRRSLA